MRVIVRPRPSFTVPNLIAKQCERQPDAQLPHAGCQRRCSARSTQRLDFDGMSCGESHRRHTKREGLLLTLAA